MPGRNILICIHLLGNAVLLWLAYRWLGLDESDGQHLLVSFGVAAIILVSFAWLQSFAFAKFSGLPLARAISRSLLTLIPFALLCLIAIVIYSALASVQSQYGKPAFVIASFLTLHLRRPIPPAAIQTIFHVILLISEWAIVPAALLRVASRIATSRWSARSFLLDAALVAAFLLCAIWVPFKLFFWVPKVTSFNAQFWSLVGRVGLGYLLFVFGILVLEFITVSGKPAETQLNTVARP